MQAGVQAALKIANKNSPLPAVASTSGSKRQKTRLAKLREVLRQNVSGLTSLLSSWDEDEDGDVDKKDFWQALRSLKLGFTKEQADSLFDSLDVDGSGSLEYEELEELLEEEEEEEDEDADPLLGNVGHLPYIAPWGAPEAAPVP